MQALLAADTLLRQAEREEKKKEQRKRKNAKRRAARGLPVISTNASRREVRANDVPDPKDFSLFGPPSQTPNLSLLKSMINSYLLQTLNPRIRQVLRQASQAISLAETNGCAALLKSVLLALGKSPPNPNTDISNLCGYDKVLNSLHVSLSKEVILVDCNLSLEYNQSNEITARFGMTDPPTSTATQDCRDCVNFLIAFFRYAGFFFAGLPLGGYFPRKLFEQVQRSHTSAQVQLNTVGVHARYATHPMPGHVTSGQMIKCFQIYGNWARWLREQKLDKECFHQRCIADPNMRFVVTKEVIGEQMKQDLDLPPPLPMDCELDDPELAELMAGLKV